jgi:hypothetical protein
MSSIHRLRVVRTVAAATALISSVAWATVESSCPAPCATPPKVALFVRARNEPLTANGDIAPLTGTLMKGVAKTVVRIDASVQVESSPSIPAVFVGVIINHHWVSDRYAAPCSYVPLWNCSVTGTFWFDIDALEASYPGDFIGQPLEIGMGGGSTSLAGSGLQYEASFSAQVVKKK